MSPSSAGYLGAVLALGVALLAQPVQAEAPRPPVLAIFADGKVVLTDPEGKERPVEGKLTDKELKDLLRFAVVDKKFFEKDPALSRRFQLIKVEEPDEKKCTLMLRGVVPALEKHHTVRILDEGLEAAVKLSHRYLPDRQLPDKAVSVLDTACARLALGQNVTPPAVEDCQRTLDDCAVQTRVLEREASQHEIRRF